MRRYAVDRLTRLDDPGLWVSLGDFLSAEGDRAAAVRAYQTVLRPAAGGRRLDETTLLRVRGDLARALAGQGHDARAEWLLRRCVFVPGLEAEVERPTRRGVYDRLNLAHLDHRPMDAAELAYLAARRAERLRAAGHIEAAFAALVEPRYALEPLLGIVHGRDPVPAEDRFGDGPAAGGPGRGRATRWRERDGAGRPFYPKAWALNFLGKGYRLSCALALELGRDGDADRYLRRGIRALKEAIALDPLLPYPYGHWLALEGEARLPTVSRARIRQEAGAALAALARWGEDGAALAAALHDRFPVLDTWPGRSRR